MCVSVGEEHASINSENKTAQVLLLQNEESLVTVKKLNKYKSVTHSNAKQV